MIQILCTFPNAIQAYTHRHIATGEVPLNRVRLKLENMYSISGKPSFKIQRINIVYTNDIGVSTTKHNMPHA